MNVLKTFFGSGKGKDKDVTPQEAIQKLRETQDMLQKKSDFLENKVSTELQTAKKHGTKNKRLAIQALKRKRRCEKQLQQIDGTLSTIEFQLEALENATTNTEVLAAMGLAANALKKAHKHMDIDDVNNMMDDVAEQQQVADEIANSISNPVGFGNDYDEDELMNELEDLEQSALDEQLLQIEPTGGIDLPAVPKAEPAAAAAAAAASSSSTNDQELRELEMWAS